MKRILLFCLSSLLMGLGAETYSLKRDNSEIARIEISAGDWKVNETGEAIEAKHRTVSGENGLLIFIADGFANLSEISGTESLQRAISRHFVVKSTGQFWRGSFENVSYVNFEGRGAIAGKKKIPVDFAVYAYQPKDGTVAVILVWAKKGKLSEVDQGIKGLLVAPTPKTTSP